MLESSVVVRFDVHSLGSKIYQLKQNLCIV